MGPLENFFIQNIKIPCFKYKIFPDGSDSIEFLNESCESLWEIPEAELKGDPTPLWDAVNREDFQEMQNSIQYSAETLSEWNFEWRITTHTGKKKWLKGRGTPRKEDDRSILWATFIEDITARKQWQQSNTTLLNLDLQLQVHNKNLDHELKNLLTKNQIHVQQAQNLISKGVSVDELRPVCEKMTENSDRIIETIQKIDSGKEQRSVKSPVILNKVIQNCIMDLSSMIDSKVKIIKDMPENCMVLGNKEDLEQVFINLLKNALYAIKFLDEQIITISASIQEGYVLVSVTDSGMISEEVSNKMFNTYFTTKPLLEGNGIGLMLSKKLIEAMGGNIMLDKQATKTTIMLELPYFQK
jgi:PAS domain S-box-containing protein